MKATNILEEIYAQVTDSGSNTEYAKHINILIEKITKNKSLVSAIATSLLKKIVSPEQDIRLHRTDFEGGYSARSLDTKIITPFFKKYFLKYANKESAFLTLATRERIKWTKEEGKNLKIRNKILKEAFLSVLEIVENDPKMAREILAYLFFKLKELVKEDNVLFHQVEAQELKGTLTIPLVIKLLEEHFSTKLASRLPVIAIYSIYEIICTLFNRYDNKFLKSLAVHTASDKKGFGDIEIYDADNKPFEIIEIKHQIPIDRYLIYDILRKINATPLQRYYVLTTFSGTFVNQTEEDFIFKLSTQLKKEKELDLIVNGVIPSLKYYLRFIDDYELFIESYSKNLVKDARNSTEIKTTHLKSWQTILQKYDIN